LEQIPPALLFEDLKVIELAGVLAGPAAGMFFAELGATVIKVENKLTGGDVTRTWKQPVEKHSSEKSAYYHSVNWGKQSLLIDLTNAEERAQVYELMKDADIIIANYKADDAAKLGMDYATVKKLCPQIIYACVKGWEDNQRVAFDAIIQAETGFMSMNGTMESGPLKLPVAFMDIIAAHLLKEAILTALLYKTKSGKGSYVETSLEKAGLSSLINQASNYLNNNTVPQRMGSLHPNIAPYGEVFHSMDGKSFLLAAGSDEQFRKLSEILNMTFLIDDVRFRTNTSRVANRNVLAEMLSNKFAVITMDELRSLLESAGIPFGEIRNVKEVLDQPRMKKYMLEQEEADGTISRRMMTAAFTISG
jgi:crotonobetainyl-CoA:carnitine CoA-transferase CaiB-like acyl-CoA transferase